jgi:dUTP pyrophosphatase
MPALTPMILKYVRLHPQVHFSKAYDDDAAFDLQAVLHEGGIILRPQARVCVPTGIAVGFDDGYFGLVCPRSGLAKDHGVTILNAPGVIDKYIGEIKVVLVNTSPAAYSVKHLDRIAQLVVLRKPRIHAVEVEELEETERGSRGFGSTGR